MTSPIRPKDLPSGTPTNTAAVPYDSGTQVLKATPLGIVDAATPLASQAEAEAGTDNSKRVTPLRVAQAIAAQSSNVKANASALGVAATAADMGAFSGTTIPDDVTAKVALQSLETAVEARATWVLLASQFGAAAVGWVTALTGGVARTISEKFSDSVSIKDFGAVENGDATATRLAIQAALDTGVSLVRFPGKDYLVDGELVTNGGQTLRGDNMSATRIRSTDLSSPIIRATGTQRVSIKDMRLGYFGAPLAGAHAIVLDTCYFCDVQNVWAEDCWVGLHMVGGGNHSIIGYRSFSYVYSGLVVENCIDVNLTNFRMSAMDSIRGTSAGITLTGAVEAFTASQGDITLGSGHGISLNGTAATRGNSPWYNKFVDVYCDSTKQSPIWVRMGSHNTFVDCWAASGGHDEAVGFASALDVLGIEVIEANFTKFIGGEAYGNGGSGAIVYPGCKFTLFDGMTFKLNRYTRPTDGPAISVLANATDFMVRNCLFERDADTVKWRQSGSVAVAAGTSDRYNLSDNLLGGCAAPVDGGTGVNKRIENNY